MNFWKRISPRGAIEDFASEWRRPTRHRWAALGVSMALTFAIMMVFLPKNERVEPRRPEVFYISTYAEDRTREEIIASNIENQKRKEELQALLEERAELRKSLYRELGRATFVDVDAMEAEIERDQAAGNAATVAASDKPENERGQ